jgi:membrane protein implicated in regulation of membrane protease activity
MKVFALSAFLLLATAPEAMAYIGPGPGLSMLGTLITLVVGVVVALLMVFAYPIRLMLKRRKEQSSKNDDAQS